MFYSLVRIEQCPLRCGVAAIRHPVPTIRNGAVTALGRVTDASPDRIASDDRVLYPRGQVRLAVHDHLRARLHPGFNFKLTYLSRRTQISTRFLVFLAIFLAFAMTASALIGRFFVSKDGQAWIETGKIATFLLVTPAFKLLWAAVAGSGLTAIIGERILIPCGTVAGQQTYKQYSRHEGEAAKMHLQLH